MGHRNFAQISRRLSQDPAHRLVIRQPRQILFKRAQPFGDAVDQIGRVDDTAAKAADFTETFFQLSSGSDACGEGLPILKV